ncbi:hypothetical protein EJ419_00290 [Alloscardovia theropitheci]|uniref:Uncharacterized protein n=1 Tax=Alloscardovia theropitheci TaxID=2496842 RepID=A0A4R0R1P1_9BIFI|nr:hypothetical protein [Alloscardovia theropitheci]TCD55076.1 hypothetical protein EJ419_00290 [Alloscardovia theropitheci]
MLFVLLQPLSAQALGGSCSAWMSHDIGSTIGVGECQRFDKGSGGQVTLDIAGAPDRHSGWFRDNKRHQTDRWIANVQPGYPRSARVDFGVWK